MAVRLAKRFGTTAEFWLGLQMDVYNKPSKKFRKITKGRKVLKWKDKN